jgi:hypothetical protein
MATLGKPKILSRTPTTMTTTGSASNKQDHMQRRKSDGLSHREVAEDFGVSKSTSHRLTGNASSPKRGSDGFDKADIGSKSVGDTKPKSFNMADYKDD